jgi:antitoxin PrlF
MYKAKITTKGQITIPAAVREAMGLNPGGKVAFFKGEDGEFMLRPVRSIMELKGCLAGHLPPMTVTDMDHAIGEAVKQEHLKSVGEPSPRKGPKDEAA